jgi:hypothetical protein
MIGIYKITNKNNNKSYIGQSIHCGKRLDEHSKGEQFIDEIIQLEGIENFDFNILKEVDKVELNYWEDYYIIKYNTLFPNGYNRKMNTNKNTQKEIKKLLEEKMPEEIEKELSIHPETLVFKGTLFKIYIGLFFSSNTYNDLYYIDKSKSSIVKLSKESNISRPTFYKYYEILKEKDIIKEDERYIYVKEIKEITNYITKEEFKIMNYKKLYVLWKIRQNNNYGIKDFYLYELFWGEDERKKLNTSSNKTIKRILEELIEIKKISARFPKTTGHNLTIEIESIKS